MHVALVVHTSQICSKLCTSGLVEHNSERWNLVTQVLACDAQPLKREKSCARGDFLCKTHNYDTKFFTCGLVVHNSIKRPEAVNLWDTNTQLLNLVCTDNRASQFIITPK